MVETKDIINKRIAIIEATKVLNTLNMELQQIQVEMANSQLETEKSNLEVQNAIPNE